MRTLNAFSIPALVLLGACGGGGGGGGGGAATGTLSLSAANSQVATGIAFNSATGLMAVSGTGTGVLFAHTEGGEGTVGTGGVKLDLKAFCGRRIQDIRRAASTRMVIESGPNGGTVDYTWTDVAPVNEISTGDSFTLAFDQYVDEDFITVDGTVILDNLEVTGGDPEVDPSFVFGARIQFQDLTATEGTETATLNGALSFRIDVSNIQSILDFTVNAAFGDASSDVTAGTTIRIVELAAGTFTLTSSGFVRISEGGLSGTVRFTTPTALTGNSADTYPSAGVLLISGAANTAVKLTALDSTMVRIEVDANGDGTFESSEDVLWTALEQ